jgi:hypothetical protein
MGTYYKVVCDDMKEAISPGLINGLGIKFDAIAHPQHPFGQVVIFAGLRHWFGHSMRVCSDSGDDEIAYDDYSDITEQVLVAYNALYGTNLRFTPRSD